jgi:hypothetical protein
MVYKHHGIGMPEIVADKNTLSMCMKALERMQDTPVHLQMTFEWKLLSSGKALAWHLH